MRDKEGERLVVDMEDLFSIHPGIGRPGGTTSVNDGEMMIDDGSKEVVGCGGVATDFTDLIKAKIASHPRYPSLLSAYIDCRKVGAPPEMAILLEVMARERSGEYCRNDGGVVAEIAADPELDKFMDSYCRALVRYKDELSKPFDDAMSFISSIEAQLLGLSKTSATASSSSSAASATASAGAATPPLPSSLGSSDEEPSYGDDDPLESYDSASRVPDNEVKEMLFRKYSGYLSSLKKEFLKKRNKGKIPREARSALLDWWNIHYQWPYPTEEEKVKLAELTGLDQKQINNWFINQRKRHWKPSEDMQLALVEPPWSGSNVTTFCFETGAIGP